MGTIILYGVIGVLLVVGLILFIFRKNLGGFFRFLISKMFLINLAVAIICMVTVVYCAMKGLAEHTNHGVKVEVPYVIGKHVDELPAKFEGTQLRYVIDDSTYSEEFAPGTVIRQHPNPKTDYDSVKPDRKIHITIVKKGGEYKEVPYLVTMEGTNNAKFVGRAEAKIKLTSRGFVPVFKTFESERETIKSLECNGKEVKGGDFLLKGSEIVVNIGSGKKGQPVNLPDVIGLNVIEANNKLSAAGLFIDINYDPPAMNATDSSTFVVTSQSPRPSSVPQGLIATGTEVTVIAGPKPASIDTTGM